MHEQTAKNSGNNFNEECEQSASGEATCGMVLCHGCKVREFRVAVAKKLLEAEWVLKGTNGHDKWVKMREKAVRDEHLRFLAYKKRHFGGKPKFNRRVFPAIPIPNK